jgi:hypothetical protein
MAKVRLGKDDLPWLGKLGGVFVVIGVGFGALNGDGLLLGAVAGALMFGIVIGVGWLCTLLG